MTTGLVLGKFMPPHAGHQHLCTFAAGLVDRLCIVVGTLPTEPIPGALRHAWMTELFPGCDVVHLPDVLPQLPEEHPHFWDLWREALSRVAPYPIDVVVASEPYGARLAEELGARFVPCDLSRSAVSISGTEVRARPLKHWRELPTVVRPYFVKRVAIVGGESVGKSTLTAQLAAHFHTVHVPEYARTWLETYPGTPGTADFDAILRGQHASETSLARQAHQVLFTDTDRLCSTVWAEVFEVELREEQRSSALHDPYHLTLLLRPDVPWVADPVRYLPHDGADFHQRLSARLQEAGRGNVVELSGSWEERWQGAVTAVERLIETPETTPSR